MNYKSYFNLLPFALVVLVWGCATIMHGTTQNIGVSSLPTGASVTVNNVNMGVTPMFAKLKRGDDHIVTIEMPGFQKVQLTVTKSVSGWVWGNIIFGGLIGLAVDAASGGLYDLSPEQLNAELKKENTSAIPTSDGLYIVSVLRPDPAWHRIASLPPTQ